MSNHYEPSPMVCSAQSTLNSSELDLQDRMGQNKKEGMFFFLWDIENRMYKNLYFGDT